MLLLTFGISTGRKWEMANGNGKLLISPFSPMELSVMLHGHASELWTFREKQMLAPSTLLWAYGTLFDINLCMKNEGARWTKRSRLTKFLHENFWGKLKKKYLEYEGKVSTLC